MVSVTTTKPFSSPRGLPRKTASICPECKNVIPAVLKEKDSMVIMEKTCKVHGYYWDIISRDVELYLRMEQYARDGVAYENPYYKIFKGCPTTCGMCDHHKSHTGLALMDLTNRCNLKCPVCFANANAAGYVYEPTFEQVKFMLKALRDQKPVPAVAVQFSGGEPTISPIFLDACQTAWDMGFSQIQVATNGIRFASSIEFVESAMKHHLHTIYLQFDGVDDSVYMQTRAVPLTRVKDKVVNNVRTVYNKYKGKNMKPPTIVLVPTIVNGFNEHQVVPILNYAIDNLDIVRGVNYQPVALTARIPDNDRFSMRFTQSDLVRILTTEGPFEKSDFFPVPSVAPISELIGILKGTPKMTLTTHPGCGLATFAFVNKDKKVIPLPRFMDVDGFFGKIQEIIDEYKNSKIRRIKTAYGALKLKTEISKYFDFENAPDFLNKNNLLDVMSRIFSEGDKRPLSDFTWGALYVGAMHFQDSYDYDIQRLMRCDIHYTSPDGRIIPFCSYNSGPVYREEVEKKFSVPVEEWKKKVKSENKKGVATIGVNGEVVVDSPVYSEIGEGK
ncbi:MAG: radical SAM protein [Candidatus Thermoplasmatota archaeon]|nr:radical SAM protein [Candidatus Thermoplasmatota archaeon]MCL5963454.1 radical SAM protein [Candidatus Thermoplasmatota archaeon]